MFTQKKYYGPPKSILITGASDGIGAGLAEYYATEGVTLFLSGRNEERLLRITKNCQKKGADVFPMIVDVTDQARMQAWMDQCDDKVPLDLVIANAGISGGTGSEGESIDQARQIYNVNVKGVFNTIGPAIDRMTPRKHGQIAIMSSLSAFNGWAGAPAYSSSKAAVRTYGEGLRIDLKNKNIRVNVICPGFVKTAMTDRNDFSMPFLMSVEKAAIAIANGLAANKGRIVFPWQMYGIVGFIGILPYFLCEKIMRFAPAKADLPQ